MPGAGSHNSNRTAMVGRKSIFRMMLYIGYRDRKGAALDDFAITVFERGEDCPREVLRAGQVF